MQGKRFEKRKFKKRNFKRDSGEFFFLQNFKKNKMEQISSFSIKKHFASFVEI